MILRFENPVVPSSSVKPRRFWAATGFALFLCVLGGCSQSRNQDSTTAQAPATIERTSQQPPIVTADADVKSTTADGAAPAGSSWSDVLRQWWQAASKPPPAPGTTATPIARPTPQPSAAVDVAALAARHPAWKLADALEQNRVPTQQFEAIRPGTPAGVSTLAAPNFDVAFSRPTPLAGENVGGAAAAALPNPALSGPEEQGPAAPESFQAPVVAVGFEGLQAEARERQESSINSFLRVIADRQSDWQRDYRAILRSALQEEVEAAAERAPKALALVLPAPAMQLEMTNLRLSLLNNVFSTPEEREATRERLGELLTQWRAALRDQESARARELARLRVEEPARVRREGESRLQSELEVLRLAQQQARAAVLAEHQARLAEDFGNEQARLALVFPVIAAPDLASLPLDSAANEFSAGASNEARPLSFLEDLVFMRTNVPRATSVAALVGTTAISAVERRTNESTRSGRIQALRQLAWRDAVRQARMAQRLQN